VCGNLVKGSKHLAVCPCARVWPWGHWDSVPRVLLAEHTDICSTEVTIEANEYENKTSERALERGVNR
jgi:hypothetical protein